MQPPRIVIYAAFADPIRAELRIDADIVPIPTESGEDMARAVRDADVLVNGAFRADWAGTAPGMRLVHAVGAGYDGIALDALPAGCVVANVYGHEYGIAEYAFMTMAALNRELLPADLALRSGEWRGGPLRELRGRRLLIVGLGHIGREVARWAAFVGMPASAVTEHPTEERRREAGLVRLGVLADLEAMAHDTDFLLIAIPHASDTTNLIDERVLAALPPHAYLINVGRGPVVDQWALYTALSSGRLAGAAIDVWYHYPDGPQPRMPSDAPFQDLPNVILTPHTAGYTEGTMRHRYAAIAANIRRLVAGEPLANVVWPRA
jgi:phosphoglycerate dehydrogenase-like enzyme